MKVLLQLFALPRQLAGTELLELQLPDGASVGSLRAELARRVPALEPMLGHLLFAVNSRYADDQTLIPTDAQLACIPPVSGG